MPLQDKVAVITGAARGMGRAYTREFLKEGAKVVALDLSWEPTGFSGDRDNAFLQELQGRPNDVITVTCDLDCAYVAQLYRLPGKLLGTRKGTAIGGRATRLSFMVPKAKATYRVRLTATAPVNPGPPTLVLRNVRPG